MILPGTLLVEIGCEEIPARMIAASAAELERRVAALLDAAGLAHGAARAWGGTRRLAARFERVAARQDDREELLLGPPAAAAFDGAGRPTAAAAGFARKHGVDAEALTAVDTERGRYAAVRRTVAGRSVGELLAERLPPAVADMPFPKTMRWGDGSVRWVRPVHWVVALHDGEVLPLELFGVRAGRRSAGHRFLGSPWVDVPHAMAYESALETGRVIVAPEERRERLTRALAAAADELGGSVIDDPTLLLEVADLVEWPGVVAGRFDERFLELPRELLVTTLRHHQKCFSVEDGAGRLVAAFLAVANTDRDPAGHVRRGNEWVVGGRLEDARFFWTEDRKQPLAARQERLAGVLVHRALGTQLERSARLERLARWLASRLGLDAAGAESCAGAARLAKHDLVTGTVGEFPELQGRIGGLLLAAEGAPEALWRAVYAHYQPLGPEDSLPPTLEGCVVALADKLETVSGFVRVGEAPSGSKDPFGLRRASNGIFRILGERPLPLGLDALVEAAGGDASLARFLSERLAAFLRDQGYSANEVQAVFRPRVPQRELSSWPLAAIRARLEALRGARERDDFRQLVKLTERVDTILVRNAQRVAELAAGGAAFEERDAAALALAARVARSGPEIESAAAREAFAEVLDRLAALIDPVEQFFDRVLVIDERDPQATRARYALLERLRAVLTRDFDIRELAGQADRRTT